jgi:maleate isomerase
MTTFSYTLDENKTATLGMVVLQTDERIESDMRQLLSSSINLHITRIPSGATVTTDTLSQMENDLPAAAGLLPRAAKFDVVGYGCTSGTSVIGAPRIAELVRGSCDTSNVTEPVSALIAACKHLALTRIAFLSPYVETVSQTLRDTLADAGIETPVFGSFDEASEERVVRISANSTRDAAIALNTDDVDAIFLSCTNLNTLPIIDEIEAAINKPVLSSNQVLAWHLSQLSGVPSGTSVGRLMNSSR